MREPSSRRHHTPSKEPEIIQLSDDDNSSADEVKDVDIKETEYITEEAAQSLMHN